jgi:uncharacterized protein (TIGR03118 family)
MKLAAKFCALCFLLLVPAFTFAQHYNQTNLVSDISGAAAVHDPNLQNAWGIAHSATSPWWVSNNNDGTSTLYNATGLTTTPPANPPVAIVPINGTGIVTILNAPSIPGHGVPTGILSNGNTSAFILPNSKSASFIFVTEDGTVQGWNGGATAVIVADNSQKPNGRDGAVYKGAALVEISGQPFILAANFRKGRIDVFDSTFKQVHISEELFDDDDLPRDYAPFNVQGIGPNVYVAYAKRDAPRHDEVAGIGFGFVDVFTRGGRLIQRLEHGPWFNAPWGITLAPAFFGEFSHAILIGNFQGQNIAAFNPVTGRFIGNMLNPDGSLLKIDGLWALAFGNGGSSGPANTLFFSAGPNDENDGLFGTLTPIPNELTENDEQ